MQTFGFLIKGNGIIEKEKENMGTTRSVLGKVTTSPR
jgi:hypothetical protein